MTTHIATIFFYTIMVTSICDSMLFKRLVIPSTYDQIPPRPIEDSTLVDHSAAIATADSVYVNSGYHQPYLAIDGTDSDSWYWHSETASSNYWFQINFQSQKRVTHVEVYDRLNAPAAWDRYDLTSLLINANFCLVPQV
jgi:hypothetical protein